MMDNRTGHFETAGTMEELEQRIPQEHRGPAFTGGETVTLRGGDFRVISVMGADIVLHYIGPSKLGQNRRQRRARGRRA